MSPVVRRFSRRFSSSLLVLGSVVLSLQSLGWAKHESHSRINTVAGDGAPGTVGQPFGVEIGPDGALYICEVGNHRISRLDLPSGDLTIAVGTGEPGYSGDGGPALGAMLNEPYEVRFDQQGNMYFVEMKNHLVRRVELRSGVISTVAGTGQSGFGGDGGPAIAAQLSSPHSIALDGRDQLYIADIGNHRIRCVDLESGKIETLAGTGELAMPRAGQSAHGNPILGPRALFVQDRTLWIALREGHSVWTMSLNDGTMAHVAGNGEKGYAGDAGPAIDAQFNGPKGIAVGPSGHVYVVDTENHAIRKVDIRRGTISTIAGRGPEHGGYGGDGGPATEAMLDRPHGVCLDAAGNVFIGDTNTHRVRRVSHLSQVEMPTRGICAHRGASATHPENTIAALREAIRLGAHMIEFDVALSQDEEMVLMHDDSVDRTTDGEGPVAEWSLADLQQLDAGSWKADRFKNERIPTLEQALEVVPDNIWLNVHLKGVDRLAEKVARTIVEHDRLHQAFLACGANAANAARQIDPRIQICNMDRQDNSLQYVNETIQNGDDFIQLLGGESVDPDHTKRLGDQGVYINYCCTNEAVQVRGLFESGVEFPLVDRAGAMLRAADAEGIDRLRPIYRSRLRLPGLGTPYSTLVQQRQLEQGSATQGIASSEKHYFSSTAHAILRYDTDWNLLDEQPVHIEGVNHIGAIDYYEGFLWAGLLFAQNGPDGDPGLKRSVVAKIRASDLSVVKTWDITQDVTWIDPVCFDGQFLWVGDLSDLGIHRYRLDSEEPVRDGVFRYPAAMHLSQGIRVVGRKLYTIHTFGDMDGLFEFDLPDQITAEVQQPKRVWMLAENQMHLEGFDFVPGMTGQIWHAQGSQVDRYELQQLAVRR